MNDSNSGNTEIKVKTAYNGEIMITYINENISFDELCNEIRGICRFSPDQVSHLAVLDFYINFDCRKWNVCVCDTWSKEWNLHRRLVKPARACILLKPSPYEYTLYLRQKVHGYPDDVERNDLCRRRFLHRWQYQWDFSLYSLHSLVQHPPSMGFSNIWSRRRWKTDVTQTRSHKS